MAEAYKFVDEIRKLREIGRRDFGVILKCEDDLMGMSQDPWMEKISKVRARRVELVRKGPIKLWNLHLRHSQGVL